MNDQQHDRRASAACGGRLPFGGKMNDEDEITDLRRQTVHGNGAAPILVLKRVTAMFEGTASATFVHRLKARTAGKEFVATAGFRARQDESWEVRAADLAPGPSPFSARARYISWA
jgi:hypothetical protein